MSGHPDKVEEQAPTVVEAVSVEELNNPEYEDVPQEAQARSADYGEDDLLGILFLQFYFHFLQFYFNSCNSILFFTILFHFCNFISFQLLKAR